MGILILIGFGGGLHGITYPLVLVYALYTKLPFKPNQSSHIRSIPPSKHKDLNLTNHVPDRKKKKEKSRKKVDENDSTSTKKKNDKDTTNELKQRWVKIFETLIIIRHGITSDDHEKINKVFL